FCDSFCSAVRLRLAGAKDAPRSKSGPVKKNKSESGRRAARFCQFCHRRCQFWQRTLTHRREGARRVLKKCRCTTLACVVLPQSAWQSRPAEQITSHRGGRDMALLKRLVDEEDGQGITEY